MAAMTRRGCIDGLELVVSVGPMAEADMGRVSRLTLGAGQFSFSPRRRSESDIREYLARAGTHGLVVRVADRRGDYGLVGAVLYERLAERYVVDSFLLSRRVLGCGVEHAVLHEVGRRALADGAARVDLAYAPNWRNRPVRAFLRQLRPGRATGRQATLEFAAADLAGLSYEPGF